MLQLLDQPVETANLGLKLLRAHHGVRGARCRDLGMRARRAQQRHGQGEAKRGASAAARARRGGGKSAMHRNAHRRADQDIGPEPAMTVTERRFCDQQLGVEHTASGRSLPKVTDRRRSASTPSASR